MKTKIIGLMTDWGRDDGAFGSVQGVIWGINPKVQISDMSQNVNSWDIKQGAFLLTAHYRVYPEGTIFVVVVDPGVGTKRKAIVVETYSGYYFIGPDNGVMSWALRKEKIRRVVNVVNGKYFRKPVSAVFEGRDVFCPVAAHISNGVKLVEFGKTISPSDLVWAEFPLKEENGQLIGEVLFIDRFGNLITSINSKKFREFVGDTGDTKVIKPFRICIKDIEIKNLKRTYADGKGDEALALFGGDFGDFLDIVVRQGSAAEKFNIKIGERIVIKKS